VGVTGVTLWFQPPGANQYSSKPMAPIGRDVYQAVINTSTDGFFSIGLLNWYYTATDAAGNTSRLPSSPTAPPYSMPVQACIT
jgi:hypothetical protein